MPTKRARRTTFQADLNLDEEAYRYAAVHLHPHALIREDWDHFENYHRAHGSLFAERPAASRTGVCKSREMEQRRQRQIAAQERRQLIGPSDPEVRTLLRETIKKLERKAAMAAL